MRSHAPLHFRSCDSTVPSPAVFKTLTTWHCEKGAEWVNCGAIQFEDFLLVNNEEAAIDVKLISGTKWGDAKITNAVIIGHSEQSEPNYETKIGIVSVELATRRLLENVRYQANMRSKSVTYFSL